MCFPNGSWSFGNGFFEQFLNFFQKSGNQVKKSGEKAPWNSRRRKSALLTGKEKCLMGVGYRNSEGYWDPVPFAAAANVEREAKKYRPLVYICSPYRGDPERNAEKTRGYSRFAVDQGMIPLAPYLLLPQYMKEEKERDLILFMDLVLLGKCSEVWVFGSEITDGMKLEIGKAKKRRMTVRYFTEDLKEA